MSEKDKKALIEARLTCLNVWCALEDSITILEQANLNSVIKPEFFDADDFQATLEYYYQAISQADSILAELSQLKDVDWEKEIEKFNEEPEKSQG